MKVKDIMETDIYTLPLTATYEQAAKFLYEKRISGVLVVNPDNTLAGVLSEKDLFKVLYPYYKSFYENPGSYLDPETRESKAFEIRNHPISGYITTEVVTVEPETPVLTAGARMLAKHIHRLPVVQDGKLVGIVTRSHLFRSILKSNFNL